MKPSILIAGVGNIFLGDDAFGVEVARALAVLSLPESVSVVDYGIRGFDLAFALLNSWAAVIIVDALPRGEFPGTLFTLEPDLSAMTSEPTMETEMNPHGMDPVRVLHLALSMGSIDARVLVVGCEPEDFGAELEGRMGLSTTVQAVIPEAVAMIGRLVGTLLLPATGDSQEILLTR